MEKVRQMAPGLIVLEATGGNGSYGGMILGEAGTFCLLGIGLIFYLALPIWGGVRASRSGHPGWAAVAILSIFIGLGPIGGILALTACVEPALRASPKTLDIDGVNYLIERVLYRKSIGVRRGSYFVVLFGAENISDGSRVAATENWKLQYGEALFAPEWSLSTAAAQAFPGRNLPRSSRTRVARQKMCAVFETPPEVYPGLGEE